MSEALVSDVVVAAIGDGVARLIRNEAAIRQAGRNRCGQASVGGAYPGEGVVEAVHQARVATRRLRSDLRTFRGAIDPRWATELRAELDWLGGVLGGARDADVLLARLSGRGEELSATSADGAGELRRALAQRCVEAHAAVQETLRGERHSALVKRLTEAVRAPALAGEASRPAASALPRIVRASWRTLARRVCSLDDPPSDAELHAVRIGAKRCRYAAEACAPSLGTPARRLARATASLQDALGELSDAVTAERWLREWAQQQTTSPAGAFAAGELAGRERAAARRARSRWRKAWRGVAAAAPR